MPEPTGALAWEQRIDILRNSLILSWISLIQCNTLSSIRLCLYKLHMHTYLLLAETCTDEKSCGITLFTALWGTHTDTHTLEISTCAQIVIRTHKHTKTAQLLIQDKCSNCIPWGPILSAPGYQNILQYHLSLWQPWKRRRCRWRRRDVLINDHH